MTLFRHDLIGIEHLQEIITQKSRLILEANDLWDRNSIDEAQRRFAEAARLEEQVATILREAGQDTDHAIALMSAASCWKRAGVQDRARTLFDRILARTVSQQLRKKIVKLQEECGAVTQWLEGNIAVRAARILLLLKYCSDEGKSEAVITGLTRLAKLDFFLRYPKHLVQAIETVIDDHLLRETFLAGIPQEEAILMFNKLMTRHHFGPWDHNYYNVFAFLTSKGLISVSRQDSTYVFRLENLGYKALMALELSGEFKGYTKTARVLGKVFGDYLGSQLKHFIYEHFTDIANAKLGETLWEP